MPMSLSFTKGFSKCIYYALPPTLQAMVLPKALPGGSKQQVYLCSANVDMRYVCRVPATPSATPQWSLSASRAVHG